MMGMVIAWHAVNAAASLRKDDRYTTLFLAMTPGHTVRERLAVLEPSHPNNVYDEMRLLPESKRSVLGGVSVRVDVLGWRFKQCPGRIRQLQGNRLILFRAAIRSELTTSGVRGTFRSS